jgi:hypothetical protein
VDQWIAHRAVGPPIGSYTPSESPND